MAQSLSQVLDGLGLRKRSIREGKTMALMQVLDVTDAKSGRSLRVKLGTQWYGAYKDSGIQKNMVIDPVIETLEKGGPWIVRYTQGAAPQVPPSQTPPLTPAPAVAAPTGNGENIAPWWQPFVSNTVAHAIQAGLCKSPTEINQWALIAAQVAVAVKSEVGT